MTTQKPDAGVSAPAPSNKGVVDWTSHAPKSVDSEDALGTEKNKKVWETAYKQAGLSAAGEEDRRSFRAGIYVYCCKNGTSREGDYSGEIVLSNGKRVSASVIPGAAGKMHIRKFLRANADESYDFFKQSHVMEADARFVTKWASLGIAADVAFATADWLSDCSKFTPAESRAHMTSLNFGLQRARRARGGRNLEEVESERVETGLRTQGPMEENETSW